jgi:hypothetical protein
MSTRTTVDIWQTVKHWAVKGRPATQKWRGNRWVGMPGNENPRPGNDYRIEIAWGPRMRITGVENWLEHVELRVVFEGWRIRDRVRYQNSLQFYTDSSFSQPTSQPWRVHLDHGDTVFQPHFADIVDYAYFRVTTERNRAWRMKYNIGIYGSVHQGTWKRVTAR